MLKEMSSYRRTVNEGGRRRNEGFWGQGLNTNWRRRSNRKRRARLRRRGDGASEGKGRSDKSRRDDVQNGSKIGRRRGQNI
jgi:hypothetical protein